MSANEVPKYIVGSYEISNGHPIGPAWIYADNNIVTVKRFCKNFLNFRNKVTVLKNGKPYHQNQRYLVAISVLAKSTDKVSKHDVYFEGNRYKPYGSMELVSEEGTKKYLWFKVPSKKAIFYKY